MRRSILVYDTDCGPCTRFKQAVDFLDTRRRFEFMGLTEADSTGVLDRIPPSLRHRSFHLVGPDGDVLSGAAAIPTLVGLLPGGRLPSRFMVLAPGGLRAVGFVYAVFSRLHDTGSCRYRPGSGPLGRARRDLTYPGGDDEPPARHQGLLGELGVQAGPSQG